MNLTRRLAFTVSIVLACFSRVGGAELKIADVASQAGDGPDEKGNTADDTWQFWFELAHQRGLFHVLDTHSRSVPEAGVKRRITGPIAGFLPNPKDSEGWIFYRDWDGRFEGVWGDSKAGQIIVFPYVEKNTHLAVAVTYKIPTDGKYNISGKLTDLQVQPQFKQHDGVDWRLEVAAAGETVRLIGKGGPLGDGNDRPDSAEFKYDNVDVKEGQLIRLVVDPRGWWGSDMTQIKALKIEVAAE